MSENYLLRLYKILRIFIFAVPAASIVTAAYLILFPIENFGYFSANPELSKFAIEKDDAKNKISFGVFPTLNHRYIELNARFRKTENQCLENPPKIILEKTYQAFLLPDGNPIRTKDELKDLLFRDNKTSYPNGSLLHLKPTDEVYLLTNGKKTLFPGQEIFRAFGYSFDNLADVEKSALDQFPDAYNRVFLWTHPHPDGAIFQTYPSRKFYLIADGKKCEIENPEDLRDLWPKYFTIAVSDPDPKNSLSCLPLSEKARRGVGIFCLFDRQQLATALGGYYSFTLKYPDICPVSEVNLENGSVKLLPEKSFSTIKDSLRRIFASAVNRYFLKQ